jgi:hypothetical protein
MTDDKHEPRDRLAAIFNLISRVGAVINGLNGLGGLGGLNGMIDSRAAQVAAFELRAVRRAASVFALALVAALFVVLAAGFAAFAIMAALWDTHRVLGAACIGGVLVLLAGIAGLLARGITQPN